MFLCTFGLKEWAVWNWMLRKKSENHLYSHTSPHYGRAAPSAPQNVPGLIHKNMSIVTRDTKLKLQIPQSRNYSVPLCEYLLVTALDLQAVLLSLAQIQHHCATRQSCVVTISLFMTSPPHTHKVEHTWFWHADNGGLAANEFASYVQYYLSNLSN